MCTAAARKGLVHTMSIMVRTSAVYVVATMIMHLKRYIEPISVSSNQADLFDSIPRVSGSTSGKMADAGALELRKASERASRVRSGIFI